MKFRFRASDNGGRAAGSAHPQTQRTAGILPAFRGGGRDAHAPSQPPCKRTAGILPAFPISHSPFRISHSSLHTPDHPDPREARPPFRISHFAFPISHPEKGFTIIELLVATAVLLLIMVMLLQVTGTVANIWRSSSGKISAFQNARAAFGTIRDTLSRATLNTYNDYVDAAGNPRTNAATFVPAKFARASELHLISGPAASIVPGANAASNPGDAIFFQVPMGYSTNTNFSGLERTLNSTGFYVRYAAADDRLLPAWLKPLLGEKKRFRLLQFVEPSEALQVYASTGNGTYNVSWLDAFGATASASQERGRVIAEDVPLLVFRPRLSPQDEADAAAVLAGTADGSLLSPNFHYDSRAWQTGYGAGFVRTAARVGLMRNQVPPVVDVAMVSVDRQSLARFDQTGDTPPAELRVPAGLFTDSAKMDDDLETYGRQLSQANIRFKIFRTSVEIKGAKWSN
jgi:uncharacterized protein (TIGR02599 family)